MAVVSIVQEPKETGQVHTAYHGCLCLTTATWMAEGPEGGVQKGL